MYICTQISTTKFLSLNVNKMQKDSTLIRKDLENHFGAISRMEDNVIKINVPTLNGSCIKMLSKLEDKTGCQTYVKRSGTGLVVMIALPKDVNTYNFISLERFTAYEVGARALKIKGVQSFIEVTGKDWHFEINYKGDVSKLNSLMADLYCTKF